MDLKLQVTNGVQVQVERKREQIQSSLSMVIISDSESWRLLLLPPLDTTQLRFAGTGNDAESARQRSGKCKWKREQE